MRLESVAGVRAMRSRSCLAAVSYCPRLKCVCAMKCSTMDAWCGSSRFAIAKRSEEPKSELQSRQYSVCRLLLKKKIYNRSVTFYEQSRASEIVAQAMSEY